jgi:hypothetical protein
MSIRLDSIDDIPNDLINRLKKLKQLFAAYEFLDEIMEHEEIQEIIRKLDEICTQKGVIGFHYTRAVRSDIETYGLILQAGDERRKRFIREYSHLFTEEQIEKIKDLWQKYFTKNQSKVRDNRIWFAFTLTSLHSGAKPLLLHYGGEQIYMPLIQDSEFEKTLQNIGEPLIVECLLKTENLKTFSENPWGKVWLSTYHTHINPHAHQHDIDAYQQTEVSSNNIICKAYKP